MKLTDYLKKIDTTLQAQFQKKASKDFFSFEYLPSSSSDNVYRISITGNTVEELSAGIQRNYNIDVWFINKLPAAGKRSEEYYKIIDELEQISIEILKAFKGENFNLSNTEIEDYGEYIISKIGSDLKYEVTYE